MPRIIKSENANMLITLITFCLWIQPQLALAYSNSNSNSTNNEKTNESCDRSYLDVEIPYPFVFGAPNLEVIKVYSFSNSGGWSAGIIVKKPIVTTFTDDNNNNNNNNNSQCEVCIGNNSNSSKRKTPFCLSSYNIVASEGCDGYEVLYDETDGFTAGCSSIRSHGGYNIRLTTGRSSSSCRYALLIRDDYYSGADSNASTITAFPKILGWPIQDLGPGILSVLDWIIFAICIGPIIGMLLFASAILWWCWS